MIWGPTAGSRKVHNHRPSHTLCNEEQGQIKALQIKAHNINVCHGQTYYTCQIPKNHKTKSVSQTNINKTVWKTHQANVAYGWPTHSCAWTNSGRCWPGDILCIGNNYKLWDSSCNILWFSYEMIVWITHTVTKCGLVKKIFLPLTCIRSRGNNQLKNEFQYTRRLCSKRKYNRHQLQVLCIDQNPPKRKKPDKARNTRPKKRHGSGSS